MEVVNDVGVVQVHRGRLVCQVHRVIQREVPDGEGLKLGIACWYAAQILMVDLRERSSQLAGARPRRGNHHEVTGGLNIVVLAQAILGDNEVDVGGVTRDDTVARHSEPQALEALDESLGLAIAVLELGHDNVIDQETAVPEDVDKPQHIIFIEDP